MTRENTGDPDENAVASRPLSVRSDSSDVETMLKREYLYFMNVPRQPSVPAGGGQTDLGDSLLVSRQQSMVSETVSLNSSLLHTVGRTYPGDYEQCLVPAATAIHITMYCPPDCFDIGSIAVSAVQKYSLSLEEARHLRKQHLRRKTTAGCFRSLLYILPAMFVLGLGVAHAVLLQEKRLEQYMAENGIVGVTAQQLSLDSRVVVWAVLESVVLFVLFVQHCLSPLLSLGHRSRRSPHRPIAVRVYDITVILNIVLCVAVGVLMGMIVSLTPHSRGGVEWSKWTVLPYSRRVWVSYLPRWCMLVINH
ncbi:hypothetical protein AGDE_12554 [Angomonas deanei]|nr:hypothetical protein AGDE_12554 [Angomonas deanei]|eukprot:EPY24041.1 hypothetical protein AGDE_12554 [Angomonas deanei]